MWASRNQQWGVTVHRFCRAAALTKEEVVAFHVKQRWIADAAAAAGIVVPGAAAITTKPVALMYGSVVAGTAFTGGDVDYAVAFPSPSVTENNSASLAPFHDVARPDQSKVLSQLYTSFMQALPSPSSSSPSSSSASVVTFQRIFHARVPIVQCGITDVLTPNKPIAAADASTASAATATDAAPSVTIDPKSALLRWPYEASKVSRYLRPGARSPLYAFHSEFDVSASLTGCRNSLLLRHYSKRYPLVQRMVMVLKHWGRRGGPAAVLNAKSGWLSPYALNVMLIYYLAQRGLVELAPPSVVEPLIAGLGDDPLAAYSTEELVRMVTSGGPFDVPKMTASPVHLEIGDEALFHWEGDSAQPTLAELLRGFFEFYGAFEFEDRVIDIRAGVKDIAATKREWQDNIRAQVVAAELQQPTLAAQEDVLGVPPVQKSGETMQGRPLQDRCLWHRLGFEAVLIRDPIETHSLGRGVDFFRAEAIRDAFAKLAKDSTVDPLEVLKLPGVKLSD